MSVSGIILTVQSQDLDFKHHMFCSLCLYFGGLRLEVRG